VKRKFARRADLSQGDGQSFAGALPQPIVHNHSNSTIFIIEIAS
jgi:hypothetical protein